MSTTLPDEQAPDEANARQKPAPADTETGLAGPATDARRSSPRYYELDVLRFLAASGVVLYHFFFMAKVTDVGGVDTGFNDHGVLRYGRLGVDTFFVISGFVILQSTWNKSVSAFVASRVARLYPGFWVAVVLTASVCVIDPNGIYTITWKQFVGNLTMIPLHLGIPQIDLVYWTLLYEFKFYIIMASLLLLGRFTLNRVLVFATGWLALSIVHTSKIWEFPHGIGSLLIAEWSAHFIVGILFALIARDTWRLKYLVPLAVAMGWAAYRSVLVVGDIGRMWNQHYSAKIVVALMFIVFASFAIIVSGKLRVPGIAKIAWIGALTYPLYLLHENIGFVLFRLGQDHVNRWALAAGVIGALLTLSWAVYYFVERPLQRPFARLLRWEPEVAVQGGLAWVRRIILAALTVVVVYLVLGFG